MILASSVRPALRRAADAIVPPADRQISADIQMLASPGGKYNTVCFHLEAPGSGESARKTAAAGEVVLTSRAASWCRCTCTLTRPRCRSGAGWPGLLWIASGQSEAVQLHPDSELDRWPQHRTDLHPNRKQSSAPANGGPVLFQTSTTAAATHATTAPPASTASTASPASAHSAGKARSATPVSGSYTSPLRSSLPAATEPNPDRAS